MPLGKGQRKLIWGLVGSAAGLALLLVSLPLWFPWVLGLLARRLGVNYSRYERLSYGRFALNRVNFTNQTSRVYVARLEGFVPTVWLWKLTTKSDQAPFVRALGWRYDSLPGPPTSRQQPASVYEEAHNLAATFAQLQRWVPTAVLSNGTLGLGSKPIAVSHVTLAQGAVRAEIGLLLKSPESKLTAELRTARPFVLQVKSDSLHLESILTLSTNAYGLDLQSTNFWWSNRMELLAHFSTKGALPETATLTASNFTLPSEVAGIPNYRAIAGSLVGNWQTGSFALELSARAEPAAAQTNLPPLNALVRVQGDTNAAAVQTLEITSPALTANLSKPLAVHFTGPPFREAAALTLRANLARQNWLPLAGVLAGSAELSPTVGQFPRVRFRLSGSEIGTETLKARTLTVSAECDWPQLHVADASAAFDDGSVADLKGTADLRKKSLSEGSLRFNGPLARQWLPYGYWYETLALSANFEGPLYQLRHSGHMEAGHFTSPQLQPVGLQLDWHGRQEHIESFEANLFSTNASLLASGGLTVTNGLTELQLSSLSFTAYHHRLLELKQPSQFSAQRDPSNHIWQVTLSPFDWEGSGGQFECSGYVNWPERGEVRVSLRNFSSTNFAEFAKTAAPEVQIKTLKAMASWTNGPADFALELSTLGRASGGMQAQNPGTKPNSRTVERPQSGSLWQSLLANPVTAELKLAGDQTGITLSNLVVKTEGAEAVAIHGFVPITFHPAASSNLVNLEAQQPLRLTAVVQPQAALWDQLEDLTGITLEQPELKLSLSGTWQDLRGGIAFEAKQIAWQDQPSTMPSVQNIRFQVQLDREQAQLTKGALQLQGQPVSLTAKIPLGQNFWLGLKNKQLPDWQQATARLRIEHAKLAAFEPLFPELLAPQGELDAELALARGAKFSGTVIIRNARTRPLSDLGPIRDININLRCRQRFLELQNASAKIGGAPVALSGGVDFSGTNWLRGALPPFEISVNGTDVPLSRQPESIIRSDLLLGITKTNGAPPLISGVAHLRDSFYLSDLSALVPGKVASPSARPPYFSIQDPLLADWRVAVSVDGMRFIKVRSTVFNGEVSANLTLQGTLKDPIALGDLKIDSGLVRFPFANLQVQQGLINLTSQNPYHPQLLVSAISKQFGYDIRMEVSGTADAPIIQFTSNPPLSSEQIVLLITAGQMPQGAYTLTPQQRAQTVAMFLGSDLLRKLGFGDQTEQRLTIRSGEQISTQGKPTYNLEYKLTDRWAVTGEYDRFGDYNAGLKWRIYSK